MIQNQCQFLGRLGSDIKVMKFDSGDRKGSASLAVDDSYKNKSGEKVEKTVWVNLVFRNKLCDVIEKHTGKGTRLLVQGKYSPREYEVDGQKKYANEFIVNSAKIFFDNADGVKADKSPAKEEAKNEAEEDHDDLPF